MMKKGVKENRIKICHTGTEDENAEVNTWLKNKKVCLASLYHSAPHGLFPSIAQGPSPPKILAQLRPDNELPAPPK